MRRDQLSDLSVFVEVARSNGFRAAAKKLNLGAGSVSEAVQRFEDRLGVRLLDRTTRSVALTLAGEELYRRSLPAITELEGAVQELNETEDVVSGTLRLSAPWSVGALFLDDLIAQFALAHPNVGVEIMFDDRKIDLVTTRVDATIRSQTLLEHDTHALPIGPDIDVSIVATASYLERRGTPTEPADLVGHDGICFAFGDADRIVPWNFVGKDGLYSVMPKPRIVANDLASMLRYAEAGLGLAYVFSHGVQPAIDDGRLVRVALGQIPTLPRYTLNYLSKRHMPGRLRAFIDLAKKQGRTVGGHG